MGRKENPVERRVRLWGEARDNLVLAAAELVDQHKKDAAARAFVLVSLAALKIAQSDDEDWTIHDRAFEILKSISPPARPAAPGPYSGT